MDGPGGNLDNQIRNWVRQRYPNSPMAQSQSAPRPQPTNYPQSAPGLYVQAPPAELGASGIRLSHHAFN